MILNFFIGTFDAWIKTDYKKSGEEHLYYPAFFY